MASVHVSMVSAWKREMSARPTESKDISPEFGLSSKSNALFFEPICEDVLKHICA